MQEKLDQGGTNASNVFSGKKTQPAHTRYLPNEMDAFLLFLPSSMIRHIITSTEAAHTRVHGDGYYLCLGEDEFLAFLSILIARGVLQGRNEPPAGLWSTDDGRMNSTIGLKEELIQLIRCVDCTQRKLLVADGLSRYFAICLTLQSSMLLRFITSMKPQILFHGGSSP